MNRLPRSPLSTRPSDSQQVEGTREAGAGAGRLWYDRYSEVEWWPQDQGDHAYYPTPERGLEEPNDW